MPSKHKILSSRPAPPQTISATVRGTKARRFDKEAFPELLSTVITDRPNLGIRLGIRESGIPPPFPPPGSSPTPTPTPAPARARARAPQHPARAPAPIDRPPR
ncbi:hypothetical protein V493_01807 [Pseudogymnoascus sp. VKM F-4281 (FW-2241)]|nr:hypothetical protein V493_01807 [Pseudogymnoascus sp. VKM F-4281 (FW-2241)]